MSLFKKKIKNEYTPEEASEKMKAATKNIELMNAVLPLCKNCQKAFLRKGGTLKDYIENYIKIRNPEALYTFEVQYLVNYMTMDEARQYGIEEYKSFADDKGLKYMFAVSDGAFSYMYLKARGYEIGDDDFHIPMNEASKYAYLAPISALDPSYADTYYSKPKEEQDECVSYIWENVRWVWHNIWDDNAPYDIAKPEMAEMKEAVDSFDGYAIRHGENVNDKLMKLDTKEKFIKACEKAGIDMTPINKEL